MKNKITLCLITTLFSFFCSQAQEVSYNKKKNVYEVNETPIAKFNPVSSGKGYGRSFYVMDMANAPLLDIKLVALKDTLFDETFFWYIIDSKPYNMSFMIDNPVEVNGEKYFSKLLLDLKLIKPDGGINEENLKKWATNNTFNFQAGYDRMNDSCKNLLNLPLEITNRRNGDVLADAMGRIGQSNVVIGKWEKYMKKAAMGNEMNELYIIKNNAGRIVATVNTEYNTTLFTFGKKRRLSTTGISEKLLQKVKGESDASYITRVATVVIREGVL